MPRPDGSPTLQEQMGEEFRKTLKTADDSQEMVEPTEAEARNGWTAESLTSYLAEQKASQSIRSDPNSMGRRAARIPRRANSKYRPLRWRG